MFGVRKERPNRGSNNIHRSLTQNVHVNKQASLLPAAARTTEVSELKWDLERTGEELGLVKRQLEENKGK